MARRRSPTTKTRRSSGLRSLTPGERAEVLDGLLVARPVLGDEAERIAKEFLSSSSTEDVASEVESVLASVPLDALATRAGRVRGRGYVHETDAAWELIEEAIEPFRADLKRRAAAGFSEAAASVAVGIVAGLYRVREPETGSVLAYAGEDAPRELAAGVMDLAARLGVVMPGDPADTFWAEWDDLR